MYTRIGAVFYGHRNLTFLMLSGIVVNDRKKFTPLTPSVLRSDHQKCFGPLRCCRTSTLLHPQCLKLNSSLAKPAEASPTSRIKALIPGLSLLHYQNPHPAYLLRHVPRLPDPSSCLTVTFSLFLQYMTSCLLQRECS